jgi:hypothetical protein
MYSSEEKVGMNGKISKGKSTGSVAKWIWKIKKREQSTKPFDPVTCRMLLFHERDDLKEK